MNDSLCYLNGEYQALADAKIPVLDRGFIFGDGVYEVVPVYARKLFRFEQHMQRLTRSLSKVGMGNPLDPSAWLALCRKLVADRADADQMVYIQVTRGVARRDHVFPTGVPQTVFAMTNPLPQVSAAARAAGVACVTTADFRWHKGDIKSTSLLGAVLARQLSADVGAVETIMFRDGFLTEASASNVWLVQGGKLIAPLKDHLKLEGIRYALLEELCAAKGLAFELRPISEAEVRSADELLLTSATKEVLAVTQLDGVAVGSGKPGPVYAQTYAWYQEAKAAQSL
jgi:D-alanine transaminase